MVPRRIFVLFALLCLLPKIHGSEGSVAGCAEPTTSASGDSPPPDDYPDLASLTVLTKLIRGQECQIVQDIATYATIRIIMHG
ncbi:hypothetical protein ANCCEY_07171 [Ancylostoma ceylanicum]|uniref:Uncharacterized protein n=1 Tax=Ancylostoma ceylanicum TaxID=53326 RepID=A0A0D6LPD1_9BILA|nr:hypothetical protein ANCCEY_07171 [Ancylostoma ceylanicum]